MSSHNLGLVGEDISAFLALVMSSILFSCEIKLIIEVKIMIGTIIKMISLVEGTALLGRSG